MLYISNLSFSYNDEILIENLNLSLTALERVVIVGDNGVGKTTLLKLIAGELQPGNGTIKTAGSVGFLTQTLEEITNKSGGERTQAKLAELFRNHPEILLLDEPTNNLDTESKRWLIRNLQKYRGLVLIVSHDRDFIDQVADKVLFLQSGKIELFSGNYSDFSLKQEQKRHELSVQYSKSQTEKQKLLHQLKNVDSYKYQRQAFDKTKHESKMQHNSKRGLAQKNAGKFLRSTRSKIEQLNEVEKPYERKIYAAQVSSNFTHRKKLVEGVGLSKSINQKTLFLDLNFTIFTSERVRINGKNGSGKSTLFKIILGEELADSGTVKYNSNIKVGYISQDIVGIDLERSFIAQNPNLDKTKIYQAATTMDFRPASLERPAKELSRGQLTKLAIVKLILAPLDLIILDEVTNHLDIRARQNIEFALQEYRGAILIATHDEAFAQNLNLDYEITL